jgi:anhydro-N-acetylmuramic acid kinase
MEKQSATFQIGEPAYLVELLRAPVVSNFRAADLAAGGQGAPLATLFHRLVFGRKAAHVCVNNLGGISNVTSIDSTRGPNPKILAFDTGPANVLLDLAVQRFTRGRRKFDADGKTAARGNISEKILAGWLKHKYFFSRPPKSTGRELFGEPFLENALSEMRRAGLDEADALANFTELTARSIAVNYAQHLPSPPHSLVLCGGGANNRFLEQRIRAALRRNNPDVEVGTADERGWPNQAVEPAAFALLAYYRWNGLAANFPETTGANRPALLGQISEP